MKLSRVERLIISNQFKILEKLYPEEKEYYEVDRKAIEEGYEIHYEEIIGNVISEDELSEEAAREVLNILSMYRAITFSYKKLTEEEKLEIDKKYDVKFEGFDANDPEEIKLLMYTRYFIIDKDRFQELVYNAEYPDFNSHSPKLDTYRKMLTLFKSYNNSNLSKEQIIKLLGVY
ncbi:YfbU family protein [Priestia aryabhattai]|uniref:YfbU family protein n=1 Tax=Priestia aryabhattai TaxID=412384 RepID=A0ABD7X3L0_PRIAR|nr:YfbU family protein [Priestia aryabhattai]WEA46827.1 YfbU family protein [Priestia aryabhattai]